MRNGEPYGFSIAGSRAIPFTIAPIACSRMPKAMLRPAWVAEKTPAPSNSVLVDSARSAAPPTLGGGELREGLAPPGEALRPLGLRSRATLAGRAHVRVHLVRHVEGQVGIDAHRLLRRAHLRLAQRGAVRP